jgi:hypothetical protein
MAIGANTSWRKLHLDVDEASKEIATVNLTTSGVHDGPQIPVMMDPVPDEVIQVSGYRAYDSDRCHRTIPARGPIPTSPQRRECAAEHSE